VRGGHADSARSHATSCCCLFDTSPDCPEKAHVQKSASAAASSRRHAAQRIAVTHRACTAARRRAAAGTLELDAITLARRTGAVPSAGSSLLPCAARDGAMPPHAIVLDFGALDEGDEDDGPRASSASSSGAAGRARSRFSAVLSLARAAYERCVQRWRCFDSLDARAVLCACAADASGARAAATHSAPPLPQPPRALSRLARVLSHDFFRGAPRPREPHTALPDTHAPTRTAPACLTHAARSAQCT
jgi:hypothetical protein